MIIAIDGLAGSGKTTAGKGLAKAIGFRFISSGQLYRFKALEPNVTFRSDKGAQAKN